MNPLVRALNIIGSHKPALPTWDEYLASDGQARKEIEVRWCSVGHGYTGDGSERETAFNLYCRAVAMKPKQTKVSFGDHLKEVDYDGDLGSEWLDSQRKD